ncbi:MAG: hypothetical protein AAB320_07980 [Elusimicrobiota bacterium]
MPSFLLLLLSFSAANVDATFTMGDSPTLRQVQGEAEKNLATARPEQAKARATDAYSGESLKGVHVQTVRPIGHVDLVGPQETPAVKAKTDSYHFESKTPLKGITIYTPVKDQRGDERTDGPKPMPDPFAKPMKIAAGVGILALIGAIFFPPALFVAGLALGAAATLWYIRSKVNAKN